MLWQPVVMSEPRQLWSSTTHDWTQDLDLGHLLRIRRQPAQFASGGVLHLVLEVVAYAADEAEDSGGGRVVVTLLRDGSVCRWLMTAEGLTPGSMTWDGWSGSR